MIVLGIDAAWTEAGASGIALATDGAGGWRCLVVAPSCRRFIAAAAGEPVAWTPAAPDFLDPAALIAACEHFAGARPDVIAVDMPLARGPVVRRRPADDAVARLFGRAGAAVHSPTPARPGALAERVRTGFGAFGYRLAVNTEAPMAMPALIETYPHPIVMQLCDSRRRVPYKAGKTTIYWPGTGAAERLRRLGSVWACLREQLARRVAFDLPPTASAGSFAALKPLEDGLDALVCAVAAAACAEGTVRAHGDETAAIWLPRGAEHFAGRGLPFA